MSDALLARIEVGDRPLELEYVRLSRNNSGPLLVFLHEGLGSVALWRTFPQTLCDATGCRGLVYSRAGYGRSSPLWPSRNWPVEFMHVEGRELLPKLLAAVDIDTVADPPVLVGHSDGASIALIHAASFPDRVSGIVAMAPHIFVEPLTIEGIVKTRDKFVTTDLPARLGKYHRDIQDVFWGWANVWLRPEFKSWNIQPLLGGLQCPLLLIQGSGDDYGTMAQIDGIVAQVATATAIKITACGHSPHVDQPAAVLEAIGRFLLGRQRPTLGR